MSFFYENPAFIVILGLLFLIVCIVLYLYIDKKSGTIFTAITLFIFSSWLFLERSVETDNEQIRNLLAKLVEDVKNRDDIEVLKVFKSDSSISKSVDNRIHTWLIDSGNISDIKIEFQGPSGSEGRKAETIFSATGRISHKSGSPQGMTVRAHFRLQMERSPTGKWKIHDAEFQRMGKNQPWRHL